MVEGVRIAKERVERLEAAINEFLPTWSLERKRDVTAAYRGAVGVG